MCLFIPVMFVVHVWMLSPVSCDPIDCSLPGSFVQGILQSRILEWVAMPSSRGIFLNQGLNLYLLHWQVDSSPLRKPLSSILQLRKPRPGEVTELDQCEQRGEAAVAMETLPAHLGTSSLVSSVVLSDRHPAGPQNAWEAGIVS